jgi:hypothetical protein
MIAMTQTEYESIANESLEELREEVPGAKTELKHTDIETSE